MDGRAARTRIGTIGSTAEPLIDGWGRVTPGGAGGDWLLDWWVGADDRWHVVVDEATVRQALLDHSPVVETRLRVPGGDAVHRAFGVRGSGPGGGQEYVVVEVENDSPVPFALALVVRPASPLDSASPFDGAAADAGVERIDGQPVAGGPGRDCAHLVRVNGRAALLLPRAPARAAASAGDDADLARVVTTGRAGPWSGAPALDPDRRRAAMAFVLPVTHHTTLRAVLPVGPEIEGGWPPALPSRSQVVKGWTAQAERGARVDIPDTKVMAVLAAARRRVLLYGPRSGLLSTYERLGHAGQVADTLRGWAGAAVPQPMDVADVLDGLVTHWRLTRDRSVLEATADLLADAVNVVATSARHMNKGRRGSSSALPEATCRSMAGAVALFRALGDRRAADDTQALADQMQADVPAAHEKQHPVTWPSSAMVAEAGPTGAWDPPSRDRAHIALLVANLWCGMADDRTDGQLALLAHRLAPGWHGQPVDVEELPTAAGRLSFAVRWHGNRPALLWELTPHADGGEVTITAPGLDRAWRSNEQRGEVLLAPVAAPEAVPDHPRGDGARSDGARSDGDGLITSSQPPRSVSPLVSSVPKGGVSKGKVMVPDGISERPERPEPSEPPERPERPEPLEPGASFS